MNGSATQVLNTLRSDAIAAPNQSAILAVADQIEDLIASQENDMNTLHSMVAREQAKLVKVQAKNEAMLRENLKLQAEKKELEEWKRLALHHRFGKSSERFTPEDDMQALLFNELEATLTNEAPVDDEITEPASVPADKIDAKPRGKRSRLPDDLPVREVRITVPAEECQCNLCNKEFRKIGEEVSETLEIEPAKYSKLVTIRDIYAQDCNCGTGSGICTAPVPHQVYPKSILGDSVLASVIIAKFCDALPFYRQERIMGRSNIDISRQTMARSSAAVAKWLKPMLELFDTRLGSCSVLCADETRLRVLKENGIKKDGNSYMWVASGADDYGKIVKFHYGGGRGAEIARKLLGDFKGILMCDAYGAYPAAVAGTPITLGACMAHVRRKFHDILKSDSRDPHARKAIELIKALYEVERLGADMTPSARLDLRREKAVPAFADFKAWLYERVANGAPAGSVGKAVSYTVNLLGRLEIYLYNGEVPIDNNAAENAIRPFVVGRKNWLFSAEVEGAESSAALYTLIETAKANTLEPLHYLTFLFRCYKKYGPDAMPWEKLMPRCGLSSDAQSFGVSWNLEG